MGYGSHDRIGEHQDRLTTVRQAPSPRAGEGLPSPARPGESVPSAGAEPAGPPAVGAAPVSPAGPPPGGAAGAILAGDGRMLLAGYFVAIPEPVTGEELPRMQRQTTASACLIDWLPYDGCWFGTAPEALAACLSIQVPAEARLYALLVPVEHVAGFVADIREADTYEPVLLAHLDGRRADEPAPGVAEGGRELGWEVLGYDYAPLHSWLCNGLYQDAVLDLGVDTDAGGLLPDRDTAERVAAWANARGDTKPVTWFPAALIEWDTPIESHFVPVVADALPPPPSRSWWHRLVGR